MNTSSSGIASLTCDRVRLFTMSLESIGQELHRHGHNKPVTVFDDSSHADTRKEKRRITLDLHDNYGIETFYTGLEEKKVFLDILKESLPPEFFNSLSHLFFCNPDLTDIKASGGNRNAVLSAFTGKRLISFDDDVLVRPCVLTGSSTDITVASGDPEPCVGFFPDMKSIAKIIEPFTGDPFKYFDLYAGSELEGLVPGAGRGRVTASMAGYYGGRWFQRPHTLLLPDNRLRDFMFTSADEYKKTRQHMTGCIQSPNVVVTGSPFFIGGAIAIDASGIVPPFEPHIRCSDNLWAEVLRFCNKDSMIALFPFMFYHDWTEKQPFTEKDFKKIGADLGLNMTLIFSALSEKTRCGENEDPFACFGKALVELSEMPHNKWMDMCRSIWHGYVGHITETLKGLLVKYDRKPKFWAKDVDVFMDRIRSQSMDAESFVPRELHATGTPEAAGRVHRKMLYDYGMLLVNWSRIWDEIIRINATGKGLLGEYYNKLL